VQDGGVPLWIAGGGEKVTLRIAAQYAAYTNFSGDLDTFRHKSDVLRGHTDKIGRDFGDITRSMNFNAVVGDTEADVVERLRAIEARLAPHLGDRIETEMAKYRSPAALVGTPEQVAERLRTFADAGMSYAITYFPESAYDTSGLELFEREVIAELS